MVPPDPYLEEMKKVVCIEKRRPDIPNRWQVHDGVINSFICFILLSFGMYLTTNLAQYWMQPQLLKGCF